MNKILIGNLLKAPALIILVASFFVSIYAAVKEISGIGWFTPTILGLAIILYFLGSWIKIGKNKGF